MLLRPWSPGQDENAWPAESPVWIRLKGLPYHCWSSDILLSIAGSIGKPLRLDDTTAKQRMLFFARVQVLMDVAKESPSHLTVDLEGEGAVEVEVQYENIPCSECLSTGHLSSKCPFTHRPGLIKTSALADLPITPISARSAGSVSEQLASPMEPSSLPKVVISGSANPGSPSATLSPPINMLPPPTLGPPINLPSTSLANPTTFPSFTATRPNSVATPTSSGLPPNCPLSVLPSDVVVEILGKIPPPALECSNPFSILEHCTLVDPCTSISKSNIQQVAKVRSYNDSGPQLWRLLQAPPLQLVLISQWPPTPSP
ncbi:hypothetical protein MRB53_026918 [Persea americana]|uniref:Uncharacterized protein n=1 Tax=Persea americana TaxID=3435 RepID=A0ACC2LJD4_PERAE|nr:hypothetical protein MRB53_026918 [Persea americana]